MLGNESQGTIVRLMLVGLLLSSSAWASFDNKCIKSLGGKIVTGTSLSSLIEQSKQTFDQLIKDVNEARKEERPAKIALAFKEWKRYQRMTIVRKINNDHERFVEERKKSEIAPEEWFSVLGPYSLMELENDSTASLDSFSYSNDIDNQKYLPISFRSAVTPDSNREKVQKIISDLYAQETFQDGFNDYLQLVILESKRNLMDISDEKSKLNIDTKITKVNASLIQFEIQKLIAIRSTYQRLLRLNYGSESYQRELKYQIKGLAQDIRQQMDEYDGIVGESKKSSPRGLLSYLRLNRSNVIDDFFAAPIEMGFKLDEVKKQVKRLDQAIKKQVEKMSNIELLKRLAESYLYQTRNLYDELLRDRLEPIRTHEAARLYELGISKGQGIEIELEDGGHTAGIIVSNFSQKQLEIAGLPINLAATSRLYVPVEIPNKKGFVVPIKSIKNGSNDILFLKFYDQQAFKLLSTDQKLRGELEKLFYHSISLNEIGPQFDFLNELGLLSSYDLATLKSDTGRISRESRDVIGQFLQWLAARDELLGIEEIEIDHTLFLNSFEKDGLRLSVRRSGNELGNKNIELAILEALADPNDLDKLKVEIVKVRQNSKSSQVIGRVSRVLKN